MGGGGSLWGFLGGGVDSFFCFNLVFGFCLFISIIKLFSLNTGDFSFYSSLLQHEEVKIV